MISPTSLFSESDDASVELSRDPLVAIDIRIAESCVDNSVRWQGT